MPGPDALAAAGEHGTPVFFMPRYNMWCVTRYEDVVAVLRDPDTYSSRKTINLDKLPPDLLSAFPDGPPDRVLVSLDPPDHTRLRGLARNAFTPKLVEAREAEIRTLCHALIDRFAADGRGNLVAQFAAHLPVQVITRLVGAPVEHTDDFRQWAHDRIALLTRSSATLMTSSIRVNGRSPVRSQTSRRMASGGVVRLVRTTWAVAGRRAAS